jgi:hypothetical protein
MVVEGHCVYFKELMLLVAEDWFLLGHYPQQEIALGR